MIGGALAAVALVALGVGIGFSAWGTTQPVSASGRSSAPTRPLRPGEPLLPRNTPGALPGIGGTTAKKEAFLGVEVAPTTGLPAGLTASTSATAPAVPKSTGPSRVAGAHVLGVVSTSPAAKAGIAKGDTITRFRTQRVVNAITLSFDVSHAKVGESVRVDWVTPAGTHEHATVKLTTRRAANRSVG